MRIASCIAVLAAATGCTPLSLQREDDTAGFQKQGCEVVSVEQLRADKSYCLAEAARTGSSTGGLQDATLVACMAHKNYFLETPAQHRHRCPLRIIGI
jgi:hypothetical protein